MKKQIEPRSIIVIITGLLFVLIASLATSWTQDIQISQSSVEMYNLTSLVGTYLLTGIWIGVIGTLVGGVGLVILNLKSSFHLTQQSKENKNEKSV